MAENNTGHIYTVSKLTRKIKTLLEDTFPFIWVTGEISNYSVPVSGHSYFTLKDKQSVIQAVMFKNQKRNLKFHPENGMKIFGLARITLYEPRGAYQLVFEHIEPDGTGSMQIAFEQLKTKLHKQGLFEEKFKKSIPFLPDKIGIITSATGAAVKDIINVSKRRFNNICLDIIPVKVQGEGSPTQICQALDLAQQTSKPDVIILARGGGSLEDMHAFNSEPVARAIFECTIPVITGVGHETDFTIADFVADLRAPTPSAAAELAVPDKQELIYNVANYNNRLNRSIKTGLQDCKRHVSTLASRLKSPELILYNYRLLLEDYQTRLSTSFENRVTFLQKTCQLLTRNLHSCNLTQKCNQHRDHVLFTTDRLCRLTDSIILKNRSRLSIADSQLDSLNPDKILHRGYSITRTIPDHKIIKTTGDVRSNDKVEIILSNGHLTAKVEKADG